MKWNSSLKGWCILLFFILQTKLYEVPIVTIHIRWNNHNRNKKDLPLINLKKFSFFLNKNWFFFKLLKIWSLSFLKQNWLYTYILIIIKILSHCYCIIRIDIHIYNITYTVSLLCELRSLGRWGPFALLHHILRASVSRGTSHST